MDFSRTFKALNFDFQIQGLSRTFKVRANPVILNLFYDLEINVAIPKDKEEF